MNQNIYVFSGTESKLYVKWDYIKCVMFFWKIWYSLLMNCSKSQHEIMTGIWKKIFTEIYVGIFWRDIIPIAGTHILFFNIPIVHFLFLQLIYPLRVYYTYEKHNVPAIRIITLQEIQSAFNIPTQDRNNI